MISFYPGPSKVYETIPEYVQEAYQQGVMSINHRSEAFMEISARTIALLKEKLDIPEDYTIFFTSSATECWEIIAQSLIKGRSFHLYNGAFGRKWFSYTNSLSHKAIGYQFDKEMGIDPKECSFTVKDGVICITQNETSNGTQVHCDIISEIRERHPDLLVAVDATSSMAGIALDFNAADIWFASVQKCFGLPAGLAVMVCSPKAIAHAVKINEFDHYNSLAFMIEKMKLGQTTYTPNVLAIYLLMRTLEARKHILEVDRKLHKQLAQWLKFFRPYRNMKVMIENKKVLSTTVLALEAAPQFVEEVKASAKAEGFLLGNGYGRLKENTFRIANFPAIKGKEIKALQDFFRAFYVE